MITFTRNNTRGKVILTNTPSCGVRITQRISVGLCPSSYADLPVQCVRLRTWDPGDRMSGQLGHPLVYAEDLVEKVVADGSSKIGVVQRVGWVQDSDAEDSDVEAGNDEWFDQASLHDSTLCCSCSLCVSVYSW